MYKAERRAVIALGLQLLQRGLTAGTWGNISLRVGPEALLITPSGLGYDRQKPRDLVLLDLEGRVLQGKRLPSSESPLHLAIYQAYPEAQAVIHTHSVYASALAARRQGIPALIEDLAQVIGGPVACAAYALPGTEDLAQAALAALQGRRAALLANHGAVAWGSSLAQAYTVAQVVEKAAHIACLCQLLGGGVELSAADSAAMHRFYAEHYSKRQEGEE